MNWQNPVAFSGCKLFTRSLEEHTVSWSEIKWIKSTINITNIWTVWYTIRMDGNLNLYMQEYKNDIIINNVIYHMPTDLIEVMQMYFHIFSKWTHIRLYCSDDNSSTLMHMNALRTSIAKSELCILVASVREYWVHTPHSGLHSWVLCSKKNWSLHVSLRLLSSPIVPVPRDKVIIEIQHYYHTHIQFNYAPGTMFT